MTNVPPAGDQPGWSNSPQNQPPPSPGYGGGSYGNQGGSSPKNGIGIAAMVVGIVALVLCWIPFLGLVLAIVAVVLGIVGIRKASRGEATNKGMAIAGVATGGLALLVGAFFTIATIAIFDDIGSLVECVEQAETAEEEQACNDRFERDLTR
jgi:hypothetical protein